MQTGMRTGSRSGIVRGNPSRIASFAFWRRSPLLRLALASALILWGCSALAQWSRLLQSTPVRRLEEPAAAFLQQTFGRTHLEVVQLHPLLVVATVNTGPEQAALLERSLGTLLSLKADEGERLLLVRGPVPFYLSQFPLLALLTLAAGVKLVGRPRLPAAKPKSIQCQARRRPGRLHRLLNQLARLVLTVGPALALYLGQLPLAAGLLGLELWRRLRVRKASVKRSTRPILNGPQEAAIILMSHTPEESAQVFKLLGPEQVQRITLEISKLPPLTPELRGQVLGTFENHLDRFCQSSCSKPGWCNPPTAAKTLIEFYLNSMVPTDMLAPRGGRPRRKIYSCPECDEVFIDGESMWRHSLTHSDPKAGIQLHRPAQTGECRVCTRPRLLPFLKRAVVKLNRIGLGAAVGGAVFLLTRHDPASLKAQHLRSDLGRFIGAGQIVVEVVQRDQQWSTAVALIGVSPDQGATSLPLLKASLERLGLQPGHTYLLTIQRRLHLWPLLLLPLLAGAGLWWRRRPRALPREVVVETPPLPPTPCKQPESVRSLMKVDQITLEVGRGLLSLVDPNQGARLLERMTSVRRHIALELGIVLPGVRFRDNLQLKPNAYLIKINDLEVGCGEVVVNHFLAIGPEEKLKNLRGTKTVDPTYGMPGVWVDPCQRGDAERLGCMIFDPVSVVATQLTEVIRSHSSELLTYKATVDLLGDKDLKPLVQRLESLGICKVRIWQVLQKLVEERVSIRDLTSILQSLLLSNCAMGPEALCELVRRDLGKQIVREYLAKDGSLWARVVPAGLSDEQLLDSLPGLREKCAVESKTPLLLAPAQSRRRLQTLLKSRGFATMVVLSQEEVSDTIHVREL